MNMRGSVFKDVWPLAWAQHIKTKRFSCPPADWGLEDGDMQEGGTLIGRRIPRIGRSAAADPSMSELVASLPRQKARQKETGLFEAEVGWQRELADMSD
jgi:hypothetical protein